MGTLRRPQWRVEGRVAGNDVFIKGCGTLDAQSIHWIFCSVLFRCERAVQTLARSKIEIGSRKVAIDVRQGEYGKQTAQQNEVNKVSSDPETLATDERRTRRLEQEDETWDEEYSTTCKPLFFCHIGLS